MGPRRKDWRVLPRLFSPEQLDSSWENPGVREVVHEMMRFWMHHGVSDFWMDVIDLISKVQEFPDADIDDPSRVY